MLWCDLQYNLRLTEHRRTLTIINQKLFVDTECLFVFVKDDI